MNSVQLQDIYQHITNWKQEGLSSEEILQRLLQTGMPAPSAEETLSSWKKIRTEKKRNSAFIFCGIGIFLLTTSFFFTLLLFNANSNFNFALYGLTIIGIILVFKGMIDLMS